MNRPDDNTHHPPGVYDEPPRTRPPVTTLDLDEGAREVCRLMTCFRGDYARVDDTYAGQAWSVRDHVANARMRLERLADVLALDVPVTGLEVDVARALQERAEALVRICEQRLATSRAAWCVQSSTPPCCGAPPPDRGLKEF